MFAGGRELEADAPPLEMAVRATFAGALLVLALTPKGMSRFPITASTDCRTGAPVAFRDSRPDAVGFADADDAAAVEADGATDCVITFFFPFLSAVLLGVTAVTAAATPRLFPPPLPTLPRCRCGGRFRPFPVLHYPLARNWTLKTYGVF